MAAIANSDLPINVDVIPAKNKRSKKALKEKKPSISEANILAGKISELTQSSSWVSGLGKENHESLSHPKLGKKKSEAKLKTKQTNGDNDFEKDLQEMQEMLDKLKIEKEKTEEILKEKDEILRQKEVEIEKRDSEQHKLQMELKKLQRIKEFNPTMTLPIIQSLKDKELDKKEKKKKDFPKRKRPAAAYALWCKDQWNEVKKENPDADFKKISNIISVKWKSLSPEEKKPYDDKYHSEKEAYLQIVSKEKQEKEAMKLLEEEQKQKTAMDLLDQYIQFKQEIEMENKKKTKKEKDPSKPKHPISAFFLYSSERRGDLLGEEKNLLEASKTIGEEWKNMTEDQKGPYEEIAKKNKEKYQEEMGHYKQKKAEEVANLKREYEELMKIQKAEALQLLKKKEKTENIIKKTKDLKKKQKEEKITDPNKPRRPASSFLLFSKEERKNLLQERSGIQNSTFNAMISLKWKELNEEEKKIWNEKAAESMEAYKKDMKEYNKQAEAQEGK